MPASQAVLYTRSPPVPAAGQQQPSANLAVGSPSPSVFPRQGRAVCALPTTEATVITHCPTPLPAS